MIHENNNFETKLHIENNHAPKSTKIIMILCLGILFAYMLSIGIRLFTRFVLVNQYGVSNSFVDAVFFDNSQLAHNEQEEEQEVFVCWDVRYPFEEDNKERIDRYTEERNEIKGTIISIDDHPVAENVFQVESVVDSFATTFLAGHNYMYQASGALDKMLLWDFCGVNEQDARSEKQVLYMKNGHLTYSENMATEEELEEMADSVLELKQFLDEEQIPLLYCNVGTKVNSENNQIPECLQCYENSNEKADALLQALDHRGIATLDFRKLLRESTLDWDNAYYLTDHHWNTRTQLWAAGEIAKYLNRNLDFEIDLDKLSKDAYEITDCGRIMFGSMARGVSFAKASTETFESVYPRFATNYHLEIPSRVIDVEGEYTETMINQTILESIPNYRMDDFFAKPDAYSAIRLDNDPLAIITNNQMETGKKILMIQDSYGWYVSSFLAEGVREIDVIYPMEFTGSIQTYIRETNPDMVIILYGDMNITPIVWSTHRGMFDFR